MHATEKKVDYSILKVFAYLLNLCIIIEKKKNKLEKWRTSLKHQNKKRHQILFSFSSDKDRSRTTDSRIRRKNTAQPRVTRSSRCGFVAQWLERATRIRKTLGSIPGGAALCFSFRLIRLSVLLSLSELKKRI